MSNRPRATRALGTMVAYGFAGIDIDNDLSLARRLGAGVLEILPDWRVWPDPRSLLERVVDSGLSVHSAHGCWGGQSILAPRVDLGEPDPAVQRASIDDLKRCVDWLRTVEGRCLIVHPGGVSDPARIEPRREALARGLIELADHARGTDVVLCVENMPPGVYPGSRMADLHDLVAELNRPELALALDTGHAHISADLATETQAAGRWLRTTHVHDNDGHKDSHEIPGLGTVDWPSWRQALDAIDYSGPIVLECIRQIRRNPQSLDEPFFERMAELITRGGGCPV